ncbi:Uncharacterized protein HZ326_30032 [Fusarium oxysporum f. sp. albedinis]|nr:Uncharacterized protein HZ326_30032 [Fusarium oxysporum f. sp. albedinis]
MQIQFSKWIRSILRKESPRDLLRNRSLFNDVAVPMYWHQLRWLPQAILSGIVLIQKTLLLDGLKVLITHSNFRSLPAVLSPLQIRLPF